MSESRFSRGATIATILIGLGALVISALGYLATRPDADDTYSAAVAGLCAKSQAGRVVTDSAADERGRWQKDQFLVLMRQALSNNEQRRADLAAIDPPGHLAAAHANALAAWATLNESTKKYVESLVSLDAADVGSVNRFPGSPGELNAASEALRSALAALGAPERCGFSA